MDTVDTWAAVDRGRIRLADLLADLTPEQWDAPSLCAGWRVRDVAAHVTMPLMDDLALARMVLRHPGGPNRLIRKGSQDLARSHSTDELVDRLRRLVGNRRLFPGLTAAEDLVDILAHTLDIALPLGIDPHLPVDELRAAADCVIGYGEGRKSRVFDHLPLDRVSLRATDTDWGHGTGPEVTGPMAALYLVVAGRPAGLEHVTGPGVETLRAGSPAPAGPARLRRSPRPTPGGR